MQPSHLNLWDIKRKPPHGHMPRPLMFFPYTTNSRGRVWMIIFQTRSTLQRLMFRSATRSQTGLLFSKTGDFRVFGPIFNIDKCTVPAILRSVVDTRTIIASWNPELLHVGVYSAVAYNLKHPFLSCPKREFLSNLVIAESFARIFRQNMYNCGSMAVEFPADVIDHLFSVFKGREATLETYMDKGIFLSRPEAGRKGFPFQLPTLILPWSRREAGWNMPMQHTKWLTFLPTRPWWNSKTGNFGVQRC